MSPEPGDPARCPLCGQENACGQVRGAGTCWCFTTTVPRALLDQLPADRQTAACVCAACAARRRTGHDEAPAMPDHVPDSSAEDQ